METSDSTTADILYAGDRRSPPTSGLHTAAEVVDNEETANSTKSKPRVQINLDDTIISQLEKPTKSAVPQSIKMRGNVLIQNPAQEWKVRVCELNGSFLTFFRKQKMVAAIDLEQVGDINILKPIKDSAGQGYIFSLNLKEDRHFNVRVSMKEDALNWVNVLVNVRDKLRSHISRRTKSFSSNMTMDAQTPMTDFNTSMMADAEPDDSIRVYFDSERYPPSPIYESNEKYIRSPEQANENVATSPAVANTASSTNSSPSKARPAGTSGSPKRAHSIAAIIASLEDEEAATAAEVRKGIDTSPWRVPFTEIAARTGLDGSPSSASKVRPRPFGELDASFAGDAAVGAGIAQSPLLERDETEKAKKEVDEVEADQEAAAVAAAELQRLKEEAEERYLTAERAAREKRIADERAKKLAIEKAAAEKVAEEERLAAAKAAREAKEAAEKAAREQKWRAERAAKQAKLAADKLAEEERLAAEKAAKDAFMQAERAAREKKFQADKAAKEKLMAERAAEKVIEEERLAQERAAERAARAAEREAIAKRKLADQAAEREEAERLAKQRVEEAAQRKALHRAMVAAERKGLNPEDVLNSSRDRTVSADVSLSGSQQAPSPARKTSQLGDKVTGSLFDGDADNDVSHMSRSFDQNDRMLTGIEVTMVASPRSSFSGKSGNSPSVAAGGGNTSKKNSPQKTATGSSSQAPSSPQRSTGSGGVPNGSPTGLRFPLRKSMPNVLDPKISFYGPDGSFKPLPKQSPSPATTRRMSNASTPGGTSSQAKQPSPNVRFPTRVGSSSAMPSPYNNTRTGPGSAEQSWHGALTMENVRNHTSGTSGGGSPSTSSITSSQVHQMLISDPFFAGFDMGTGVGTAAQPTATSAIIRPSEERNNPYGSSCSSNTERASNGAPRDSSSRPPSRPPSPPKRATTPIPGANSSIHISEASTEPVMRKKGGGNFSFFGALAVIALLVVATLGGLQLHKNHLAEEQWRAESLKHLQAMNQNQNQNSRTADAVSNPATAAAPSLPSMPTTTSSATSSPPSSTTASTEKKVAPPTPSAGKAFSNKPSASMEKVGKGPLPSAVPSTEVKNGLTASAPGVLVTTSRSNELMRSSYMVRKFFKDLVGAPGRFIASIFSKLVSLFK